MKEQLIEKISSWSESNFNLFFNHAFNGIEPSQQYVWETTDDGTFLWNSMTGIFVQSDGKIFKLSKNWLLHDWNMHCRLHDQLQPTLIRIDIPIFQQYINFNNTTWAYSVIQRPGNEIGESLFEYAMKHDTNTDYFLQVVDQNTILISQLETFSMQNLNKVPAIGPKLFSDSLGFFWGDIKHWRSTMHEFKIDRLSNLYYSMLSVESFKHIKINKQLVINTAKAQWKI